MTIDLIVCLSVHRTNSLLLYLSTSSYWCPYLSLCLFGITFVCRAVVVAQVGRAVASNARGPQFESSHRLKFIVNMLSTVLKRRK